jgi:hypothetical protein
MGSHFQRIVDVEVTEADARALAERMVGWMVTEGLITRERMRYGVYSPGTDTGYVPGPNWRRAVADCSDPGWLPGPVAVMTGRHYYVEGQGADEADAAICPACAARTVVIDYPQRFEADQEIWRPFRDGIAVWKDTGSGSVACPACGTAVPVTDWDFGSGFVLGALAFDFWGWPPLNTGFHAAFRGQLGHRAEDHTGKF